MGTVQLANCAHCACVHPRLLTIGMARSGFSQWLEGGDFPALSPFGSFNVGFQR